MKFLVENQFPFEITNSQLYKHRLPYFEASGIYLGLYNLKSEVLALIDEIIFVLNDTDILDTYLSGFKRYSTDVRNLQDERALIVEILNCFPESDKRQDHKKRDMIEILIKKSRILSVSAEKQQSSLLNEIIKSDDEYLFYLPFVKTFSNEIIMSLAPRKSKLFSTGKPAKLIQENKTFFVESGRYLSFLTNLKLVQKELAEENDNLSFAWDYRSKDVLELFDNGFSDKFKHLLKEGRKRIHINGEEIYLAKKAIEKLLSGRDRYYYYMPRDLAKLEEINQSFAVFDFDRIGNPEGYNKVYKTVNKLPNKYYVLLQAIKKAGSQYFDHYDEINTPTQNEIDEKIVEIFIYLLLERNVYEDNHCQLFALIGLRTFIKLLPNYSSLEHLSKAISEFHTVKFVDLKNNVSFWLCLDFILRGITEDKYRAIDNEPKPKVLFAHHGSNWEIHGLGRLMSFDYSTHMGILYLAVILKSERELNASQVKEIAYRSISEKKFLEKIKSDKLDKKDLYDILETDRKTISSAINQIKTYKQLKPFIDKYVKFGAKSNSFLPKNEIEAEVDDPNINDSFYN